MREPRGPLHDVRMHQNDGRVGEPRRPIKRALKRDFFSGLPSGKHTTNDGKSPFLMGKSTINGHFQ